ncbi:MAG TPA: succinate dehydrogenase, cytochrome b556 subunit [Casimicrobiaceae bacterium]|nr:succinate dehydrogenase, cytochrome b556 subunit [Casimicrobiaceae bacterium]
MIRSTKSRATRPITLQYIRGRRCKRPVPDANAARVSLEATKAGLLRSGANPDARGCVDFHHSPGDGHFAGARRSVRHSSSRSVAAGPAIYARVRGFFDNVALRIAAILLVWVLAHHLLAGIRHLLSDIDIGSQLPAARRSAWIVNFGGAAVALFAAGAWL